MKNPAPYRYDIVGSFLRTKAIHEARSKFEAGEISAEELTKVEDAEITGLVKKEENVGLHAVTDGEYRRSRRRSDVRYSGVPSAEDYHAEGNRHAEGPRC
ncbi:hypothetical protein [Agathobaculum butyriciproducens]|uniref:hypothetical protein n=1 Tax=Agathobaculum butyriciproducens TaxID=1628085 RepID=UPI0036D39416